MAKGDKKSGNKASEIISLAFKSLGIIIAVLAFSVCVLSVIAPSLSIKAFDFVGLKNTSYIVYQREYNRNKTPQNLYNVLQVSINLNNNENIEKYSKEMLNLSNFKTFASKIDEATSEKLKDSYSIYANSYESYVRSHLTKALYNNGKMNEAKMMAIDSVYENVDELSVYVDCVRLDKSLTSLQIKNELTSLYKNYNLISELNSRITELDEEVYSSDISKQLVILEQKIKVGLVKFYLANFSGEETIKESTLLQIETWQNKVKTLTSENALSAQ